MTDEPEPTEPTYDEILDELVAMMEVFGLPASGGRWRNNAELAVIESVLRTLERAGRARLVSRDPETWELVRE